MTDLSVIIPSRNEMFLTRTIENVLENIRSNTEIIAICDGAWPDPPVKDHPRVTLVYHSEPIGQRGGVNEGAKLSQAKFIMKLDAHCTVDEGFDVKLMSDCEYDWTVIPRMYNLHAFDWQCKSCGHRWYQGPSPEKCQNFDWKCNVCGYVWAQEYQPSAPKKCKNKKCNNTVGFVEINRRCNNTTDFEQIIVWKPRWSRRSDFWRFDNNMKFNYWRAYKKRPEAKGDIVDVMSSIGACFFMHRERFWDLGGMDDEGHGSWGQFGTEVACKSWLSGGRHVVNKKTWFSHMFRTQKGFGFPYPLPGKQVRRAREYSQHLWLGNNWDKAVHKLDWLIEKFAPVPDWEEEKRTKGLVFYTDNHGDQFLLETCRKQINRCMERYDYPIVSVSHKSIDFGKNFVVDYPRAVLSIFKQILKGLEESDCDYVFLLEHDMLYHPSHFDFTPPRDDVFYYDRNRISVCDVTGKAVFYHTNVPSMLCANRQLLIRHYSRCIEWVERDGWKGSYGYSPPKGVPKEQREGKYETYFSEFPTLDIRREDSWSRKRMDKSQFRSERSCRGWEEMDEVPGWGKINGRFDEFLQQIMERGEPNGLVAEHKK